jgi:NADH-quinone oxidoreductase subunit A
MHTDLYLSAFAEVLLFIIGGILFILITLMVSRGVRPNRPNPEKLTTYESGEDAIGSAWSQFNVSFYIVALIFLLFEVEIVFLFPWSVVYADSSMVEGTDGSWGWFALIEMFLFIGILAVGLAYAWVHGYLEWIRPDPKPTPYTSPVPKSHYDAINRKYSTHIQTTAKGGDTV